jgi:hypothetical protein
MREDPSSFIRSRSRALAVVAITAAVLFFPEAARAQAAAPPAADASALQVFGNRPGWSGVGVNIGNLVTGVTGKLWASPKVALQAALGTGTGGNDIRFHADVTYGAAQWLSPDGQYLLPLYAGLGGAVGHTFASGPAPSATDVGFRIPIGMSVLIRGNPVELFFEVAPELAVRTSSSSEGRFTFAADGAIGVRYYP